MTVDTLLRFLRSWMLAFAIVLGVVLYFGWMALPFGATYEAEAIAVVKFVQPWLIFTMLFVTFCKIDPHWRPSSTISLSEAAAPSSKAPCSASFAPPPLRVP